MTDKKELEFLLKQGEGLKLEFKENFDPKTLSKELAAFANTEGGRILIGVNDRGEAKGIHITNKLKSQIQDLARNCDPPAHIGLETMDNVLILNVEEGINKPHRCSQGFFLRQGSNSQKLSTDEIREFFHKEGKILFDDVINPSFSLSGASQSTPSTNIRLGVEPLATNTDKRAVASITNSIYTPDSYRLCKDLFIFLPSSSASSSVNLDLDTIFINSSRSLSRCILAKASSLANSDQFIQGNPPIAAFTSSGIVNVTEAIYNSPLSFNFLNNCVFFMIMDLNTSDHLISGCSSIFFFKSSGIDNVTVAMVVPPKDYVNAQKYVYVYKDCGFVDWKESDFGIVGCSELSLKAVLGLDNGNGFRPRFWERQYSGKMREKWNIISEYGRKYGRKRQKDPKMGREDSKMGRGKHRCKHIIKHTAKQ